MNSTATNANTFTAILRIEFGLPSKSSERRLRPREVAYVMENLGWLVGAAALVAGAEPNESRRPRLTLPRVTDVGRSMRREQKIRQLEPPLIKVEYGSPLVSILAVGREVTESAGGLAFLYFGLKQFFKIDLVVKTERATQRALLLRAEQRVRTVERQLEAEERRPLYPDGSKEAKGPGIRVKGDNWGSDLTDELMKRRGKGSPFWSGSATLHDDDNA